MKEQVIVFEGEHMFVAPKKRISNKSKGVSVEVPEVYAAGDPVEPAEPVRIITTPPSGSGDINVRQPQTFVTTPLPVVPETNMGNVPQRIPVGDISTPIVQPVLGLGNPTKAVPPPAEEVTPTPTTPTPPPAAPTPAPAEPKITQKLILAPTTLGSAPVMGGGGIGGGGGGGGEEEAVVPEKKSYLWLWILLAGGAIYLLTKKKK